MATIIKHLGLNRKLREGGRYGIPSSLIKNAHISDIDDLRAYMDLYMGKEDKKTWEYIYNLSGNVDSTQTGVTGEGIDYAAVTLSDPGKYLPITIFLYETPDNKLNIYLPTRGNMCLDKKPIPDCSSLIPQGVVASYLRNYTPLGRTLTDQEALAAEYRIVANTVLNDFYPGRVCSSVYDKYDHYELLDKGIFKVGPDKIEINYNGDQIEIVPSTDLMIEDFSHRVVIKGSTKPKVAKSKPVIGGVNKELLWIHPDAKGWLSNRFAWKTKGIFTGMTSDDPDVSVEEAKKLDFEDSIFQFDKGILHEDSRTGDRDSAVWRCDDWDDVWFEDAVIEKIKKLYPGIQPSDIFLSDED